MTIREFLAESPKVHVTVTFGFICFNTKEISLECFDALNREADRLEKLGGTVHIVVRDNGDDGTGSEILRRYGSERLIHMMSGVPNIGQARAFNEIFYMADSLKSNYLLMVSGTNQVVPLSSYQMVCYMIERPHLQCLSAHPDRQTQVPEHASSAIFSIDSIVYLDWINSGYAMFSVPMLRKIKMETAGAFGEPGWGLVDEDMFLAIKKEGWTSAYCTGMVYLNKKLRASWSPLYRSGVNVSEVFERRRAIFLQKWGVLGLDPAILQKVKDLSTPKYVPEISERELGYRTSKWSQYINYDCMDCQYSSIFIEKIRKHRADGIHVWAYPVQHPTVEPETSTTPVY
jgi:hypothetical protein